jgi:hypothetical protein
MDVPAAQEHTMTNDAATPEADLPTFSRQHLASFELTPFQETVKGHGVQHTGYALRLFARFDPGAERDPAGAAREVREHLCLLATEALGALPVRLLVQMQPGGRAVVAPDAPQALEAELTVIASPPDSGRLLPPAEVRQLAAPLEDRLRALGLRKR